MSASLRANLPILAIFLAVATCFVQPANCADWPQFLGPTRNGVSAEKELVDRWPAGGLPEVWRVDGGIGRSGLVVAGGKVATMWQDEDEQFVVLLDAATGKVLWKASVAPAFRNSMGNGSRATPTIDGDQVFAFTGEGILLAANISDGTVTWKQNVVKNYFGTQADYGMTSSPLVVGPLVIVIAGVPGASVIAYEKSTGKLAWKSGSDLAGYSSPTLLEVGGRRQVVAFTGESVVGLDPETGSQLWHYPFVTEYYCNSMTPVVIDGRVLISAGENHGSVLLDFAKSDSGFNVREQWTSLGAQSSLRAEWQTPVLVDGHLYGFDNVGSAGPVTNLVCVEAATGKQLWMERRFGKGNLAYADGKLFITTMVGEIVIARADPHGYAELGREAIMGGTRQPPTISDGRIYLRDNREVICLDVRKK